MMVIRKLSNMKPIVYFDKESAWVGDEGQIAYVQAQDHPNFPGDRYLRTSTVVKKFKDGSFETKNTLYKPKQ